MGPSEFSVFVGETKKATIFAINASEAIEKFRAKFGLHHKQVWAMQVGDLN